MLKYSARGSLKRYSDEMTSLAVTPGQQSVNESADVVSGHLYVAIFMSSLGWTLANWSWPGSESLEREKQKEKLKEVKHDKEMRRRNLVVNAKAQGVNVYMTHMADRLLIHVQNLVERFSAHTACNLHAFFYTLPHDLDHITSILTTALPGNLNLPPVTSTSTAVTLNWAGKIHRVPLPSQWRPRPPSFHTLLLLHRPHGHQSVDED